MIAAAAAGESWEVGELGLAVALADCYSAPYRLALGSWGRLCDETEKTLGVHHKGSRIGNINLQ